MPFSQQELDFLHKAALGVIPLSDDRIVDIIECLDDGDLAYRQMLQEESLSAERKSELEREIISDYCSLEYFHSMWDFEHGYLRHRFVAEGMGERGKRERWFQIDGSLIIKVFHYLTDDYSPTRGEPSKETVLQYLVEHYDYRHAGSDDPRMTDFINMGLFDQCPVELRENVLHFILNEYAPGENGPRVEDVILAWIKRGLLSGFSEESIRRLKLKAWVEARPDRIDYLEAGFWEVLSTHEKAMIIAPFLDKAESALEHLSGLKELPTLLRLLRQEKDSPLLSETTDELRRIGMLYSLYNPNLLLK